MSKSMRDFRIKTVDGNIEMYKTYHRFSFSLISNNLRDAQSS